MKSQPSDRSKVDPAHQRRQTQIDALLAKAVVGARRSTPVAAARRPWTPRLVLAYVMLAALSLAMLAIGLLNSLG
jgi:hypothetical protein